MASYSFVLEKLLRRYMSDEMEGSDVVVVILAFGTPPGSSKATTTNHF